MINHASVSESAAEYAELMYCLIALRNPLHWPGELKPKQRVAAILVKQQEHVQCSRWPSGT